MKSVSQLEKEVFRLRSELKSLQKLIIENAIQHKKNDDKLSFTAQDTGEGLWDWDLLSGDVYYSTSWKTMLGYAPSELENKIETSINLTHPDDLALISQKTSEFLSDNTKAFEVEMRLRHKKGHYIHIRLLGLQVIRDINNIPLRLIGTHVDISQQRKSEQFEHRYNKILKMSAQGTPACEIYDEIAYLYETRHIDIRCSMLELDGNTLLHGSAPSLPKEYCDSVNGLINGPDVGSCGTSSYTGKRVVVENIETDPKWGEIKHIALPHGMRSCWSEPIISSTGKVLGAFGMYKDFPCTPNERESLDLTAAASLTSIVMERESSQKLIKTLAYEDQLTGLSSRTHLFIHVKNLIKTSERYKERFSLLYIDLDNFKSVNDSLGHDVGDYLLQEIACRLVKVSRNADCVARIGGDEFCIVVKDIDDNYNAAIIAERAIDIVSNPIELSGRKFKPTCSIGIARYPDDGACLESMLKAADIALYAAKDEGKNCYAFYNVELSKVAEYHFKVEQYLREAIENKQLTLVYQPQIDIETGKTVGVEALSRWFHPELGQVSPVEFIEIAERIGMIKLLTEWVLDEACTQAMKWRKAGLPGMRIAVNISPSHLSDVDFIPYLKKVLHSTSMHSECLELEITEGVVQTNHKDFSIFDSLKELGVLLAIDDFGTGYSSFASLKHLRVDYLKIDKYFISDMFKDNKTKLLIISMLEIGHNLEYKVIAEGVETIEQFDELKRLGCDIAQGYLFSKPAKPEEITELIKNSLCINRS